MLILYLLLIQLFTTPTVEVRTASELSEALASDYDVRVMADTIDLTGVTLPVVNSTIHGNKKKFISRTLPTSGEVFIFNIGKGSIDSCSIIGANGNVMASGGFMGGIKVVEGRITAVNFMNLDKFGVYVVGNRNTMTDSTFITGCTFTNILRNGYGYGVWNQYGTTVIRNSVFQRCRHYFDCSSEAWVYDIQYCTFAATHSNYALHHHMYPDTIPTAAYSGAGFTFKNNYVYGTTTPFEGYRSKTGRTLFQNNYFEASTIGLLSGVPVVSDPNVWISNKIAGEGLPIRPVVVYSDTVRVAQPITYKASGYGKLVYEGGKPAAYYATPRVRTFSVYGLASGVRSLTAYSTITVKDTGLYMGFSFKAYKCTLEVYRSGVLIARLKPSTWTSYLYRGDITLKVVGQSGGECCLDDYCTATTSEPFEVTNNIRVYNFSITSIKTGRFIGESATGIYCFKFTFPVVGSLEVK